MEFLAGTLIGGLIYTVSKTNASMKIDEKAQKKYAQAFEKLAAAEQLVNEQKNKVDNCLKKVANRKRAILSTSMVDFLDVYEKIIKINFTPGDGILELSKNIISPVKIAQIQNMTTTALSPMTDKEILVTYLLKGIGGVMVDDSKRTLAMASSQMKISSVVYSQAETVAVVLDAIIERSNRIAILLAKMDLLFFKSIKASIVIIEKKGAYRKNYHTGDRKTLMTCINLADAIKKVLDVPLMDGNGEITQESLSVLLNGSEYLQKLEQM